jgi:hypothetical protein
MPADLIVNDWVNCICSDHCGACSHETCGRNPFGHNTGRDHHFSFHVCSPRGRVGYLSGPDSCCAIYDAHPFDTCPALMRRS